MTKRKNILVVSLVAMLAAGVAHAENASVTYVNTQDQKLADRIKTQDTRIGTIRDWVNPLKDGSRATLATEAQDAYRAINELKEAVDNVPAQVNADWNAESGAAQILNKPTIPTADDIVSPSELETALADKQDSLTFDTTPTADSTNPVTSGGIYTAISAMSGDVASIGEQIDEKLNGYATETYVDEKVAAVPAQVSSDWNATSGVAQILNKPTIPTADDIVSPSELETALADKQNTLTEAQLAAVNSGVTSTTVAQVAANKDAIAIQDQMLQTKANTADLAPVATSGDYADLTNKPEIPAAQVSSDWNATDGVAQILNKPEIPTADDIVSPSELETELAKKQDTIDENNKLPAANVDGLATVATSGDYADLANKPEIPAAQVQSNWTESDDTSMAFILNKPSNLATTEDLAGYVPSDVLGDGFDSENTVAGALADKQDKIDSEHKLPASNVDGLAPVATSGDYADLTNTPTIPAAQVQSNWAETDTTAPAFIQNKPEVYTKNEVDEKVADVVAGDMSEALAGYVKKSEVEDSLSSSSTNPVQNLVVTGALGEKVPLGNVPTSGEYVLGFVDGVQTYIPVVDGAGISGPAVVAIANEPGGGE